MQSAVDQLKLHKGRSTHSTARQERDRRTEQKLLIAESICSRTTKDPLLNSARSLPNRWCIMTMRIGLICLPCILLIGFFLACFLDVINIDDSLIAKAYKNRIRIDGPVSVGIQDENDENLQFLPRLTRQSSSRITDRPEHLMWFLHISDLHISMYFDPARVTDLKHFCTHVVDTVRPDVVIATGDLTDSRTRNPLGSDQHKEEWMTYRSILNSTGVMNKTVWLDVRGNHDNFNVLNWDSANNFYRTYSPSGSAHSASYDTVINTERGGTKSKFSFIAIDGCPTPGPRRPFNFIGVINSTELKRLETMSHEADISTEYTVWFGHYPTSSLVSPKPGIRSIIKGPYLCGHYHTFMNLVPNMYATHTGSFLEAEVADWKDLRRFRLAAIDHSLFSFTDTSLDRWPLIVITNPKRARDALPDAEPLNLIASSSHVRALVFSPHKILSVKIQIDDGPWQAMSHNSENIPLWTSPWNPSLFSTGLHFVRVRAADSSGNIENVENDFSLDGSRQDFNFGAKFMIRWHKRSFALTLFIMAVVATLGPLFSMRICLYVNFHRFLLPKHERNYSRRILLKYYFIAAYDKTFWPLVFIPLYATCGPWFIGEVAEGRLGTFFVWGILYNGSYLPGGFTYILATIQLVMFHIPLTLLAASILHERYVSLEAMNVTPSHLSGRNLTWSRSNLYSISLQVIWWTVWSLSCLFTLNYYYAYGLLAIISGAFVSWPCMTYVWIWWSVSRCAGPHAFPPAFRARLTPANKD